MTIKFLKGLGPEFRESIKEFIYEKSEYELEQEEKHSEEMMDILLDEDKINIKVNKVNNFYANIVKNIVSFEWCLECRESIISKRANLNKSSKKKKMSFDTNTDTIFGDNIETNANKKVATALSSIDGKVMTKLLDRAFGNSGTKLNNFEKKDEDV